MAYKTFTTEDYMQVLYDLEAGLYREPHIYEHNIRRIENKTLQISMKLRSNIDLRLIKNLIDKAHTLGNMAVHVQNFAKACIIVKSEKDHRLLEVVVA